MDFLIIIIAKYLYIVIAAITLVLGVYQPKKKRLHFFILLALAGGIAILLTKLAGMYLYDPRPFAFEHFTPLIPHTPDNGFPSDHTVFSFIFALGAYRLNRNAGGWLALLGLLVGLARVHAGLHSPIDIIGGIIIAAFSFLLAARCIMPLIEKKFFHLGAQ